MKFLSLNHSGKSESPIACSSNLGFTPVNYLLTKGRYPEPVFFNWVVASKSSRNPAYLQHYGCGMFATTLESSQIEIFTNSLLRFKLTSPSLHHPQNRSLPPFPPTGDIFFPPPHHAPQRAPHSHAHHPPFSISFPSFASGGSPPIISSRPI